MQSGEDEPRDYVLLVNSKPEKGFDLLLKTAKLIPDRLFVAIASQSDPNESREYADKYGVRNVLVIAKRSSLDELYKNARVVLVPSFAFVETFSRVCIEAQRFGKPVIGSTVGNVPFLLQRSGIVLDDNPKLWAHEIERLYSEEEYYRVRQKLALENSDLYSERNQRRDIAAIVAASAAPVLVGIGSGVGNMLHAGPMIRNIALRTGHRVDIVVAEDHSHSLFLLHNSNFVNSVFALSQTILSRHYRQVLITHSFGPARVPFKGDTVFWSRDWDNFGPDHRLHETIFNLESARVGLGIEYDDDDVHRHYLGDFSYDWPNGRLVGLHGGSKDGFWVSKRWTEFSRLATVLKEKGFGVASFGLPEEYVEGTENLTGGTISEMTEKMKECSFFISNDSGVMNIANALKVPLLALFGPTNERTRKPLGVNSISVALKKECAPCECKNAALFQAGGCRCISEISLDEVLHAFDSLVARASLSDNVVMREH